MAEDAIKNGWKCKWLQGGTNRFTENSFVRSTQSCFSIRSSNVHRVQTNSFRRGKSFCLQLFPLATFSPLSLSLSLSLSYIVSPVLVWKVSSSVSFDTEKKVVSFCEEKRSPSPPFPPRGLQSGEEIKPVMLFRRKTEAWKASIALSLARHGRLCLLFLASIRSRAPPLYTTP